MRKLISKFSPPLSRHVTRERERDIADVQFPSTLHHVADNSPSVHALIIGPYFIEVLAMDAKETSCHCR
jgi:hypothetical protein